MKELLALPCLFCLVLYVQAQTLNPKYDSALAKTFNGDDYGMKMYVLAILKTGSNDVKDKKLRDRLFDGHMKNIRRLAKEGQLIVSGPMGENDKSYRGIFILDVPDVNVARELLQTDPTIKEKVFDVDLFPWYGPAALPVYLKTQSKIEKNNY